MAYFSGGGTYTSNINPLQIAQKKIVRVIFKQPRSEHSLPLFQKLNVLPLRYLFVFKVLKIFYIRGGNRTKPIEYTGKLRAKKDMNRLGFGTVVPKPNKEAFKHTYDFLAPKLFCSLPVEFMYQKSTTLFLSKLEKWLLCQESKDVEKLINVAV